MPCCFLTDLKKEKAELKIALENCVCQCGYLKGFLLLLDFKRMHFLTDLYKELNWEAHKIFTSFLLGKLISQCKDCLLFDFSFAWQPFC